MDFAQVWVPGRRCWAVEGAGSYGAGLAAFLQAHGERVVEVARPKRPARRTGAKSDALDAVRAAREALAHDHPLAPRRRGDREVLRVLLATRHSACRAKVSATNQLKALIVGAPEELRAEFRGLATKRQIARCARLRDRPAVKIRGSLGAVIMSRILRRNDLGTVSPDYGSRGPSATLAPMTQTATSNRPTSHHRRQNRQQRHQAVSRWEPAGRPRLAWWLCASSLLLMAAGLVLLVLSRHAQFPPSMDPWAEQAPVILQFLGAPILGGLIAARRPANVYGWLWCVIGLGVGLDAFARGYATYGLLVRHGALQGAMAAAWATNFTWILGLGLLPLVLLLFPDGRLPSRRWRPLAWLILALAVALPLEGALSPESLQPFLANPIGVTGGALGWLVQAFGQVGFPLFLATLPAAALALALRFRRARGVERQQLKWFAAAGLVLVAVPIADTISPFGFDSNRLIELLSTWPLYVGIGIAILRYRLYDIDRLLNRTLVYGLLTLILGLGYSAAVLVAGQLSGGLGDQPPSWAIAAATLATAALFQPLRRRVQDLVDRRFNRRRYDAAATIEAFATRLRQQLDLDALTTQLLAVVDQTMEPTRTSLWLRRPPQPPERTALTSPPIAPIAGGDPPPP